MIYVIDSYTCTPEDEEAGTFAYARLSGTLAVDRSVAEVQVRYNGVVHDLSTAWAQWAYSGSNPGTITAEIHYASGVYFMFDDGDEIELIQNTTTPGPNTTVVTFNNNGGSGGPGTASYTYGHVGDDYYVGDFIPTASGDTFLGWYDAQTGGEQVWDEQGFFNGGSYGEATGDPSHDVWLYSGSTLTVWAHWQGSSSGNMLLAHPEGGTIPSTSGWSIISGVATKTVYLNDPYSSCGYWPIPTRSGYLFVGWYDLASGGNKFTGSDGEIGDYGLAVLDYYDHGDGHWLGYGNLSLHAHWQEDVPQLTFSNADNKGTVPSPITMTYSEAVILPSGTPYPGYNFIGWATTLAKAQAGTVDYQAGTTYKAANVNPVAATLYAVWLEKEYYITINTYDDHQGVRTLRVVYNSSFNNTVSIPTKTSYTFLGYFDIDGVQVYDSTGNAISPTEYWQYISGSGWKWKYTNNVTLYGHWTDGRHKYIYNDHKGKIEYAHGPDTEVVWETSISPDFPE